MPARNSTRAQPRLVAMAVPPLSTGIGCAVLALGLLASLLASQNGPVREILLRHEVLIPIACLTLNLGALLVCAALVTLVAGKEPS
jgi:hypothetical protein